MITARRPRALERALGGLVALVAFASCSSTKTAVNTNLPVCTPASGAPLTSVTLAVDYTMPVEIAGIIAAQAQQCFAEFGVEVKVLKSEDPSLALKGRLADFAVSSVIPALARREAGQPIVEVAQIFQRSPTRLVSFASLAITGPDKWKGKNVGVNEGLSGIESLAAIIHAGWNIKLKEVRPTVINPDVRALMAGDVQVAQISVYNQLGTLLTTKNPKKQASFAMSDFNFVDVNNEASAVLGQSLWADSNRLDDTSYAELTTNVIAGIGRGYALCRDDLARCAQSLVAQPEGPSLSHARWQINELNRLLWPAAHGFGNIDDFAWQQTVKLATTISPQGKGAPLKTAPISGYTNVYVAKAAAVLVAHKVDTVGLKYLYSTTEIP